MGARRDHAAYPVGKTLIGPRSIRNIEGMRVLNSIGPVVFQNVVFANNTKDLVKLKPPKDALSILYALEEKKMVAIGGLITDTEHAPGGNSHLNMYAMNNGIPVVAVGRSPSAPSDRSCGTRTGRHWTVYGRVRSSSRSIPRRVGAMAQRES